MSPVRPVPKSLDGRSARELFAIEKTTDNGGEPDPPITGIQPVTVPLPILDGGDVTELLAQPSADTDYGWATPWFDSTGFSEMRVIADVESAGATGAKVFAEQSDDAGDTFAQPGVAAAPIAVSIAGVGAKKSAWTALGPEAVGDRVWKARARGGNDETTPALKKVHFQFRQSTATRPPRGGTPPNGLPPGWGDVIFDADTAADDMVALYGDGDDINLISDQIAGNNLVTAATLLLPKYRTGGFGSLERPCAEWDGANVKLQALDVSHLYGDWTKYIIAENLNGGDGAALWSGCSGASFTCQLDMNSTQLGVQVNSPGGVIAIVDDDWDMTGAHIYRFVKSDSNAQWYLFVDGVLKASGFASPGLHNCTINTLMDYGAGLGLTGRIGRVIEYNAVHLAPTFGGALTNGLTGPEEVFKAFYATA